MQKKWLMYALMAFILVDILAGFGWAVTHYVFAAGRLYPRQEETLDLRQEALTMEDFRELSEKLPGTRILWTVPLSTGGVDNLAEELTLDALTEEDVELLSSMPELKLVDGSSCTDYVQLTSLAERNPHMTVNYRIEVSGGSYAPDTENLKLEGLTREDAENMACMKQLSSVQVSDCDDHALLQELQRSYPQWNLEYTVPLGNLDFPADSAVVEAVNATYAQITSGLSGLPNLKTLSLINPDAQGEELLALRAEHPDIDISWQLEIYGQTVSADVTELDISGNLVNSCEEVERLVACLPNLEKLIMSDCGIDNETMAAFRERQRGNYKVVWTVYLSDKAKCRTDDTYFMPIQQGEYYLLDEHTPNLKYCEDMICIDVGHHKIHNIDFVAYMPNLKYLILAHTEVQDVSPIVNCQELIYLEVDWSTIRDYTPISKLKKLEDLNLHKTYCDLTPIMEMTWLKNLWACARGYEWCQKLLAALPNTRVELVNPTTQGTTWRNLPNYYAMRDILGMPYMR